ncbi:hypothetical protein Prudu_11S000200, partial [Prunus dulcis]
MIEKVTTPAFGGDDTESPGGTCGAWFSEVRAYLQGAGRRVVGIIRGSTKVAVDIDDAEMQKRLKKSWAKKVEKGTGKLPRNDDEGRKALEEAHQHVMGAGPRLPPFDLQASSKLPFGMEDIFAEGVEKVDFGKLRQQKKEVNLAMHRQEVPLAFDEMYVSMAKAYEEIQRLKRRDEMAKSKMAEAQEAIREKNTMLLQKTALAKEVDELKRSKAKESYIMDRLVDEQLRWEDRLVRFNPSVEINFDINGEPPAPSPTADATVQTPEAEPATGDAPLLSLEGIAFFIQGNLAHDPVPHFENTGLDSGVVVFGDALLVRDIVHAGLVTELINEVEVRYVGWPISTGAMASIPNERENGVSPGEGLLDNFVHGFDLAIGLRMGWKGEAKANLEVRTKLFEFCIVKLPAIVCDDGVGDVEATYDILPHKGFDAGCSDCG